MELDASKGLRMVIVDLIRNLDSSLNQMIALEREWLDWCERCPIDPATVESAIRKLSKESGVTPSRKKSAAPRPEGRQPDFEQVCELESKVKQSRDDVRILCGQLKVQYLARPDAPARMTDELLRLVDAISSPCDVLPEIALEADQAIKTSLATAYISDDSHVSLAAKTSHDQAARRKHRFDECISKALAALSALSARNGVAAKGHQEPGHPEGKLPEKLHRILVHLDSAKAYCENTRKTRNEIAKMIDKEWDETLVADEFATLSKGDYINTLKSRAPKGMPNGAFLTPKGRQYLKAQNKKQTRRSKGY